MAFLLFYDNLIPYGLLSICTRHAHTEMISQVTLVCRVELWPPLTKGIGVEMEMSCHEKGYTKSQPNWIPFGGILSRQNKG